MYTPLSTSLVNTKYCFMQVSLPNSNQLCSNTGKEKLDKTKRRLLTQSVKAIIGTNEISVFVIFALELCDL